VRLFFLHEVHTPLRTMVVSFENQIIQHPKH
jgi:hypothetical protein